MRVQEDYAGHTDGLPVKQFGTGTDTQQEETERPESMTFSTSSHRMQGKARTSPCLPQQGPEFSDPGVLTSVLSVCL